MLSSASPQPDSPSDEGAAWVNRVQEHFDELGRLARSAIWGATQAKLDPDDLVQETLLVAFAHRHQYRGHTPAEFRGWLRRVLASRLSHAIRHFHQTQARANDVPLGDLSVPGSGTSPSRGAARREVVAGVRDALARLPDDYRLVLVLREQQGLSFAEIADRLSRSENAVRKLWPRALVALRQLVAADDHPAHPGR